MRTILETNNLKAYYITQAYGVTAHREGGGRHLSGGVGE